MKAIPQLAAKGNTEPISGRELEKARQTRADAYIRRIGPRATLAALKHNAEAFDLNLGDIVTAVFGELGDAAVFAALDRVTAPTTSD